MGVQFGAEVASFSAITFLIGRFGIPALNAYQIAMQVIVVALMVPLTISEASAILVGQALGRRDPIDIRSYGFSSVKLALIFLLSISVIFYAFPKLLISIYINVNDPAMMHIVDLSRLFLYVAAISQIFDGVRNVITGSLRGLHDSKYPMYIGITVMWVIAVPLGILFAFPLHIGPIGFQWSSIIAFLVGALILLLRFHKKSKIKSIQYIDRGH
jgi:MATE family multidrug resistance protein